MLEGCTPWPDEVAQRYREEGYWLGRTLGELSREWCAAAPESVAVIAGEEQLTYRELDRSADLMAGGLLGLGLRRRDRVVVQLPNILEFVPLCLALFRTGIIPVFALPAHREHEIRHFCRLTEAVAYVVPGASADFDYLRLARKLRAELPDLEHVLTAGSTAGVPTGIAEQEVPLRALADATSDGASPLPAVSDPSDVALFLVSGGTTGLPKLIPRTHDDYAYGSAASSDIAGITDADVYLAALPVAHNFALSYPGVLGTLRAGGRVVLSPSPRPAVSLPLIQRHRVTVSALVPAVLIRWLDAQAEHLHDLGSLRLLQVGGQKLQQEIARRTVAELHCLVQQAFGLSEGLCNFTRLDDPEDVMTGTQGRPISPADEVQVVDAMGRPVEPGCRGELIARGPYTIRGYYRADDHNATAFTEDGFYRTGDVVRVDADGNFLVEGRVKDMINRGGENISAEEIENLLCMNPGVQSVAVVAMPDPLLGERVCAFVVPRDGYHLTLGSLRSHLEGEVAAYKLPERLELVSELPTTVVGKIDKKRLRAKIEALLTGASADMAAADVGEGAS